MRAAAAGLLYFALVFAAGAVLGVARRFAVEAGLDATAAVLIELPLMLALSWWVCRWLIARLAVPGEMTSRLLMGGLAFVLLMAAELVLTLFALGGTVASHIAACRAPPVTNRWNGVGHANTVPPSEAGAASAGAGSGTTSRSCSHQKRASTA